jgi:hypothetical protein
MGKGTIMSKETLAASDIYEAVLPVLWQYRDDMKCPPAEDSRERRVEMINSVLAKIGAES